MEEPRINMKRGDNLTVESFSIMVNSIELTVDGWRVTGFVKISKDKEMFCTVPLVCCSEVTQS